jgi:hypothetical protein
VGGVKSHSTYNDLIAAYIHVVKGIFGFKTQLPSLQIRNICWWVRLDFVCFLVIVTTCNFPSRVDQPHSRYFQHIGMTAHEGGQWRFWRQTMFKFVQIWGRFFSPHDIDYARYI